MIRRLVIFFVAISACAHLETRARAQNAAETPAGHADAAYQHFYNLELEDAIAEYKKAIALEPENPLHYYGLADAYLFTHLLKAGKLDTRLYSSTNEFLTAEKIDPDVASVKAMWEALNRARAICTKRIAANPRDADAHYALGLTYAVEANYDFNLTRQYYDALKVGSKAKEHHQKVLEIQPDNHDANLLVGVHEYAVGSIPGSVRWLAYLAGYTGSKEHGVLLIQDAMQHGKRTSPAALTVLALIYSREKMFIYSRQMLEHLTRFFPRNFLYEMEIATSYRKENNLPAAVGVYKSVAKKMESHAPGYERADAVKLYFQIATLLEQYHQTEEATAYFERVIASGKETASSAGTNGHAGGAKPGPLEAQSYLRLGEIALTVGQREKARSYLTTAKAMPYPEIQKQATAKLKAMGNK
ncbi:MAG: tetratricopeptide repeat protein [Acidobacteria bacterium]|nr:tetratricopeptide repeat protein [Acidobacteriota bacterium]